ncbi:CYTH domain-containing protein [Massilia sp. Dwa41.01b]|uniref:CYTH domain-containing protein n=1 Tax=unclassified Massilia TaxID=2609279 RepID=UPI001602CA4E|nr:MULTISPECIES: CYTH domain-containing protein [unclassified Massilia]QNA89855.1 CYTH domain-containing protein [Massilia sp. Dwa41.01b]QNB00745.1 CYTH domain-containing protein [Massilia sp. Se16.2.3]
MGVEIERKFLVRGEAWRDLAEPVLLRQGYLSADPERVVRVRIDGERAFLTIKGKSRGATRGEWEYPIPVPEAAELLDGLCQQPLVEKYRRRLRVGAHTWEVDEFLGVNAGLVVAEIELASENEAFEQPDWVGREVTSDARYFNSNLIRQPYSTWKDHA